MSELKPCRHRAYRMVDDEIRCVECSGLLEDHQRQPDPAPVDAVARVAELEREVREQALKYVTVLGEAAELQDKLDALRAKGDALVRYVQHGMVCNAFGPTPLCCSCGLDEALNQWKDATK